MNASNRNNYAYNKNLKRYANSNRNKATKAEACLWKYALRKRKMRGMVFKRQRPVLQYIADFMCQELKLIIEVDGATHLNEEQFKRDIIRQRKLEGIGFTVIRFTDEEVLDNMDEVKWAISKTIDRLNDE